MHLGIDVDVLHKLKADRLGFVREKKNLTQMIPHDESSSVTDRTASARAPVVRRRAWAVWILPSAQKRLPKT